MVTRYLKDAQLYAVGESIVGQVRKANEDNCGYALTPSGQLFVVCDGMGGHVGGATASRIAVDSIISYITSHASATDKRVLLTEALMFANTQILGTASADATLKGMGTTACVALVDGPDVWLAHVGDSRIYLYVHKDRFLYRVSKDHSLVQGLVDRGEITDLQAEDHPQKNIILRGLGLRPDLVPEVDALPLHVQKGDILLMCSDGLSDMLRDNQIESFLQSDGIELQDCLEQLIAAANAPGLGQDNITCQLIRFEQATKLPPYHPDYTPNWRKASGPKNKKHPNKLGISPLATGLIGGGIGLLAAVAILVFFIFLHKPQPTPEPPTLSHEDSLRIADSLYNDSLTKAKMDSLRTQLDKAKQDAADAEKAKNAAQTRADAAEKAQREADKNVEKANDKVRNAEVAKQEAAQKAEAAEKRANEAEDAKTKAEKVANEANKRADEANQRANKAEQTLQAAQTPKPDSTKNNRRNK